MSKFRSLISAAAIMLSTVFLVACGGGGGDAEPGAGGGAGQTYTIGGSVAGLGDKKSMPLSDGLGGTKVVSANGDFVFSTAAATGASYNVTVTLHPPGQFCRITNGSGLVNGADVTTVALSCLNMMGGSLQQPGQVLNPIGKVSTLAGTSVSTDGIGSAANFDVEGGDVVRVGNYLYVTDTRNHTIRRIDVNSRQVMTFAGKAGVAGSEDGVGSAARFYYPVGIAADEGGNLYVADMKNSTIRKIVTATGSVTTFAGDADWYGFSDGVGAAARFVFPAGVTVNGGYIYVTDAGAGTVRKIEISSAIVGTLAGAGGQFGAIDAVGSAARFNEPLGLASDGVGNLYVADKGNHTIRKIVIGSGTVSTLAGTAGFGIPVDGVGAAAGFYYPGDIASDGVNLYVAGGGSDTIRKIVISSAEVSTMAGSPFGSGMVDGVATAARFWGPVGITISGANLFVVEDGNRVIRQVVINTALVTTLAGMSGSTDGAGTIARFVRPAGVTTDGANLYLADFDNNVIRRIEIATGVVSTLAGRAGRPAFNDGFAMLARFNKPSDVTTDGESLYVVDTGNHVIRRIIISTGVVTTVAGLPTESGSEDGIRHAAKFSSPQGIATDGANLYVADTFNHTIRKIVISTGEVSTLAGTPGVIGWNNGTGSVARFNFPNAITTDGSNLYVADTYNHTIRKIVIKTGEVTTLAGTAGIAGAAYGVGTSAQFYGPGGITTDGVSLYVTESSHLVRKIDIKTATVNVLAGAVNEPGVVNAVGNAARFWQPWGVTTDGNKLFVVDHGGATVRTIE